MIDYAQIYVNAAKVYNESRLDEIDVFQETVDHILKYTSPGKLLDIGCGTGEYGYAIAQKNYSVIGLDKSLDQIEISKDLINCLVGDACKLPFGNCSFDAVTMIMMLHQIGQPLYAVKEAARVLRPKGRLIIKTCSREDIARRITSRYFPSCQPLDLQRYPKKDEALNCRDLRMIAEDHVSVAIIIGKDVLLEKFRKRGASNIAMLSETELQEGIKAIESDFGDNVDFTIDNTYWVLEKREDICP